LKFRKILSAVQVQLFARCITLTALSEGMTLRQSQMNFEISQFDFSEQMDMLHNG